MKLNNKYPNLISSFQQALAVSPEQPGCQIDGIPCVGVLRLANCLKSAVRRSVGWIYRRHQRRTAIRKLQALNDHFLKDIGPDRAEIVLYVEEVMVMDTRSKYIADQNKPNKYSNRNSPPGVHVDTISSSEKTQA
jgi:uncharacterized protein YjiS (DUF1127 family)